MFTVALLGPEAIGTRVARELVHRLPVPALHLRDGPRPDSSNRLPPAGWLLRRLPCGVSTSLRVMAPIRRLASWWYRRAGFIVILHGRAEVEGWRSGGWRSRPAPPGAAETSPSPPQTDLVVILDEPSPFRHGRTKLRSLRFGRARREPATPDALVVVVDASRPIGQLVDEVERPIRSRAARHLVPLETPVPTPQSARVRRRGVQ
jgi:hypothetical protein